MAIDWRKKGCILYYLVAGIRMRFTGPVFLLVATIPWICATGALRRTEAFRVRPIDALVHAVTWNVNGKRPKAYMDISPLLFFEESLHYQPDVIAVGFEELVPLNARQVVLASSSNLKAWAESIARALFRVYRRTGYYMVAREQLVGVGMLVFVRKDVQVGDVESTTVKTGLKGYAGNKGGVVVRLTVNGAPISLVTSHLAAGQSHTVDRARDFHTIMKKARFRSGRSIINSDAIIWMGDLNYRVELPREKVLTALSQYQADRLLPYDQLTKALLARQVFVGFIEAPITFAPTYKYDIGTDRYDTSQKMRVPSWTDRILYSGSANALLYTRVDGQDFTISDHRPVKGMFAVRATHSAQSHDNVGPIRHSRRRDGFRSSVRQLNPFGGPQIQMIS